jgi:hypothetical protein
MLRTIELSDRQLASRRNTLALIFSVIALGTVISYMVWLSDIEPLQSDSQLYTTFSGGRSIGYPAFLAIFRMFGLGFSAVTIVQLVLFCGATWLLALETAATARSALTASFVLLGTFANFELIKYCFMIQTESFATTCSLILLALLARFCRAPRMLLMLAMSAAAGLAALVRPQFAPLIVIPVLPLLSLRWRSAGSIGALVAPATACLLVGNLAQYSLHGHFEIQAGVGGYLLGEAGKFATGNIATQQSEIIDYLREPAEAMERQERTIDSLRNRSVAGELYHDYLNEWIEPLAEKVAAIQGRRPDDIALDAAIDIIRAHPVEYLANTIRNLYGLWFIPSLMTQSEVDALNAELAHVQPLPFNRGVRHDVRARPFLIVFTGRVALILALAASVAAPLIWLVQWLRHAELDPALVAAAAASAGIHGVFLLTALVITGIRNYSVVMWPEMIFTVALLSTAFLHGPMRKVSQTLAN